MAPAQGWHAKSWSVPHFFVRTVLIFHFCKTLFAIIPVFIAKFAIFANHLWRLHFRLYVAGSRCVVDQKIHLSAIYSIFLAIKIHETFWNYKMYSILICVSLYFTAFSGGLSKFAKLARSVTRSRSALASQLSNQVVKDSQKQSNLTQVSASFRPSFYFLCIWYFYTDLVCIRVQQSPLSV